MEVLITVDDMQYLDNKNSEKRSVNLKNNDVSEYPIKKCHYLEGKYFVVIDKSIMDKLGLSDEFDIYFYQEINGEGSIVLRLYK